MSTASSGAPGAGAPAGGRPKPRADVPSLVLAALLLVMGVTLAVDAAGIEAPRGSGVVGPAAFPWVVAGFLLLLGVVLGLVATRGRPDEEIASVERLIDEQLADAASSTSDVDDDVETVVEPVPVGEDRPPFLRLSPPLRVVVFGAGLVAHALLIETAGYVVAALVLFVAVALAFGAPRLLRTVLGGAILVLAIFYAFTLGLGLALPNFGGR